MVLFRCNTTQAKYNPPIIVPRVSCNPPSAQESTNMRSLHQSGPKVQIDKWIYLSQFILSLFEGVGQLLPGDFAGLLMCRPGSLQLVTHFAKRCRTGFLELVRENPFFLNPIDLINLFPNNFFIVPQFTTSYVISILLCIQNIKSMFFPNVDKKN